MSDITFAVHERYPKASWLWVDPANAKHLIMTGHTTEIMIWHAPVNTATVEINMRTGRLKQITFGGDHASDLSFSDDWAADENEEVEIVENVAFDAQAAGLDDYSYLAYQWVESHLAELMQQVDERADDELHYLQLLPCILPCAAAWPDIVSELQRNSFDAEILPDNAGIMLNF